MLPDVLFKVQQTINHYKQVHMNKIDDDDDNNTLKYLSTETTVRGKTNYFILMIYIQVSTCRFITQYH
jgi:hypothetical protein